MGKVKFLVIVFFIFSSTFSYGQIFWGPKGSFQAYKAVFDNSFTKDTLNSKFRIGFTFGGFVNVPLKDHYSLTAELNYVRRGRKTTMRYDTITFTEKYNFIELPLLLRREFEIVIVENMKSAIHVEIGPNIAYWLGGNGEFKDIAEPFSYKIKFGEKKDTPEDIMYISNANRFLFGLELGVGINLQTRGRESVDIDLRYTHGQTFLGKKNSQIEIGGGNEFIEWNENISPNYLKANYRVVGISASYNFMLDVKEFKKGASVSDKKKKVKKKRRR